MERVDGVGCTFAAHTDATHVALHRGPANATLDPHVVPRYGVRSMAVRAGWRVVVVACVKRTPAKVVELIEHLLGREGDSWTVSAISYNASPVINQTTTTTHTHTHIHKQTLSFSLSLNNTHTPV